MKPSVHNENVPSSNLPFCPTVELINSKWFAVSPHLESRQIEEYFHNYKPDSFYKMSSLFPELKLNLSLMETLKKNVILQVNYQMSLN